MAAPPTLFDITQIISTHGEDFSHDNEGNTYFHDFTEPRTKGGYRLVKHTGGEASLHSLTSGNVIAQGLTPCWQHVNELFRLCPQLRLNF